MRSSTLAKKIAQFALTKKAHNILIFDLRELTDITDFFVICSADSDVQVKAVAEAVVNGMEKLGVRAWHKEGLTQRLWVLIDYVDVVFHVFHKDTRKFYGLEKLWGDAKVTVIEDSVKPRKSSKTKAKSSVQ